MMNRRISFNAFAKKSDKVYPGNTGVPKASWEYGLKKSGDIRIRARGRACCRFNAVPKHEMLKSAKGRYAERPSEGMYSCR
jgi:hypothetical protein